PLPVTTRSAVVGRLRPAVEVATYYVVAEGLTNIVKYACASQASVAVTTANDTVIIEVVDDGVGGADPRLGSGLHGLNDRVEARGGRLEVASPPGGGTTLRAEIPITFALDAAVPGAGVRPRTHTASAH